MNNLYGKVDEFTPDNLINDITVSNVTKSVKIKKGTQLERGTLLSKDKAGYYKKFKGASTGETAEKPDCILADNVNADDDVFAVAYATGVFNRQALILDGELTDAAEDILRDKGIYLKDNVEVK